MQTRKPFPKTLHPYPRSKEAEALSQALYSLSRVIGVYVAALKGVS